MITPGRIILYTLSENDAQEIAAKRAARYERGEAHIGSEAGAGDELPAVAIVPRFLGEGQPDCANLQVFLDGDDAFWAPSRFEGKKGEVGTWRWPNPPKKPAEPQVQG